MLSYFPQIRNEESTYSIFARLQFALQPTSRSFMGKLLFNKDSEVGRLNFQGSFDYLCSNLPFRFTPDTFLYNNTIYPFFIPFLSEKEQEEVLKYFRRNNPKKLSKSLQLELITKGKKYIRVCKECIREDFDVYGEPYYRRQHEIELNKMCSKHKIPLYEYAIFNYKIPRKYDDYFTVLTNSKEIFIPDEFKEFFLNISYDINALLTSNLDNWNIQLTNAKIITRLRERRYNSQSSSFEGFNKYYTEKFLNYIGYNLDENTFDNFIKNITRGKPIKDPWLYILIIRYLFNSLDNFINYNKKYSQFPLRVIVIPQPKNKYLL